MTSPLAQRVLALLILGGLVLLFVLAVPVPLLGRVLEKQDEIEASRFQLTRQAQIRKRAVLIQNLLAGDEGPSYRRLLFPTQAGPLASAELQRVMTDLLHANKIKGATFTPLPERVEQNFVRFGVRANFQASAYPLMDFLKALAADPRYIAFDHLRIQTAGSENAETEPILFIQIEVFALMEAPNG